MKSIRVIPALMMSIGIYWVPARALAEIALGDRVYNPLSGNSRPGTVVGYKSYGQTVVRWDADQWNKQTTWDVPGSSLKPLPEIGGMVLVRPVLRDAAGHFIKNADGSPLMYVGKVTDISSSDQSPSATITITDANGRRSTWRQQDVQRATNQSFLGPKTEFLGRSPYYTDPWMDGMIAFYLSRGVSEEEARKGAEDYLGRKANPTAFEGWIEHYAGKTSPAEALAAAAALAQSSVPSMKPALMVEAAKIDLGRTPSLNRSSSTLYEPRESGPSIQIDENGTKIQDRATRTILFQTAYAVIPLSVAVSRRYVALVTDPHTAEIFIRGTSELVKVIQFPGEVIQSIGFEGASFYIETEISRRIYGAGDLNYAFTQSKVPAAGACNIALELVKRP